MPATYRDETEGLHLQIETLLERYHEQSKSLAQPLRLLYVRRFARMLAGKVAIGGTALLAATAVVAMSASNTAILSEKAADMPLDIASGGLSCMLMALLVVVVLAYGAGILLGRRDLTARLSRAVPRTGDAHRDLAQLEDASPDLELHRLLAEQERRSIALPLVGVLMLAPIALHLTVFMLFRALLPSEAFPLAEFDDWIGFSVILVTHAQIITAYKGFQYAREASATQGFEALASKPTGAGSALGLAFCASLIPGGILFMIPPAIVAVTGAAVVLPAFHVTRKRLLAERRLLAA